MKKDAISIVALIGLAFVIAVVANAVAGRERKLVLPGFYPDPFRVPAGQQKPKNEPVAASTLATPTPAANTTASAPVAPVVDTVGTVAPALDTAPVATATTPAPATNTAATTAAPAPRPSATTPAPSVAPAVTTPAPPAAVAAAPEQGVMQRFAPHPDKPYVEVAYADVAWLHGKGALFLDARRTSVFKEGHIPGARSFSVWESDIDEKVNALFNERSSPEEQNQPIVIYCSGGACEDSHMLAQKLWGIEFNNVLVYKDGYPDWVKRGGATRTAQ